MKHSDTPISVTCHTRRTLLFQGACGQDGAIYGDFLFRFDAQGLCRVYSMREKAQVASFTLPAPDVMVPHCNTACFGAERACPEDEFPLIYLNVYNNYAREADRREGVVCVYRLTREGLAFGAELRQIIRIGFVDNRNLWKSLPGQGDVRPYGNFVPDADRKKLYAFVMRDADMTTRYFTFRLPSVSEGEIAPGCGVRTLTLNETDIEDFFDDEYSYYIQGACCADGLLFSVEGFTARTDDAPNKPRLQVIDMRARRQAAAVDLYAEGLQAEPEMVDFDGDTLCYMDGSGEVYAFDFI